MTSKLVANWATHDWREQVFAPAFHVLQAHLNSGEYVSGGAAARKDALARAIGETVEAIALSDWSGLEWNALFCGIAAHPDINNARKSALWEAMERKQIMQWWSGAARASPVNATWISNGGLDTFVSHLREGAQVARNTEIWTLPSVAGETAMIARSIDTKIGLAVLGFGVHDDPVEAAKKAVNELLLMEIMAGELFAIDEGADSPPGYKVALSSELMRISAGAAKLLNRQANPVAPKLVKDDRTLAIEAYLGGVSYHQHHSLPCVVCEPMEARLTPSEDIGTPFYRVTAKTDDGVGRKPDVAVSGCCPMRALDDEDTPLVTVRRRSGDAPVRQPALNHLLSNNNWRQVCLDKFNESGIPAGYTYLAQLLGHDMGNSVPLDRVFYVERVDETNEIPPETPVTLKGVTLGAIWGSQEKPSPVRYNLIENPLTLETVYGPSPDLVPHLYDRQDKLFFLTPFKKVASVYEVSPPHPIEGANKANRIIRALYDDRNRDTLMLHQLTVAWMQFHNRNAVRLMNRHSLRPLKAYQIARLHSVKVWHNIIREDILRRFVHPKIIEVPNIKLRPEWQLREVDLLHAVFRAFHSMPLGQYRLNFHDSQKSLKSLMRKGYAPTMAEEEWNIQWSFFLGDHAGNRNISPQQSGISASTETSLMINKNHLSHLDFENAKATGPYRLADDRIQQIYTIWPSDLPPLRDAKALADHFNKTFNQHGMIAHQLLAAAPLYEALQVEAHASGKDGGFGLLGSAVLRGSIEAAIRRVQFYPAALDEWEKYRSDLLNPETMLELTQQAKEEYQ